MNDPYAMLRGPMFATPKVGRPAVEPRPTRPTWNGKRHKASRFEEHLPTVLRMYEAGSTYPEMAAATGITYQQVSGLIQMLVYRGQIARRPPRAKPKAKAERARRQRPMLQLVVRKWPESTPCTPCVKSMTKLEASDGQ